MQKWSPDPLVRDVPAETFQPGADAETENAGVFRQDFVNKAGEDMMSLLSRQEREQIYQLVEADIETEYREKFEASDQQRTEGVKSAIEAIEAELSRRHCEISHELARETVGIAIAIAERIVRKTVDLDPDVLVRNLESMLLRVAESASFTVTVNPAEAAYLRTQSELIRKLGVTEIIEDRRIEPGGCHVQGDRQEWDATVASQLEVLAEVTAETLTISTECGEDNGPDPTAVD